MRPFGWQGVELALPPNWELSAYDGGFQKGYFRVDDGLQVRLHVQWTQLRRPVRSVDAVLEPYRKRLARKLGRDMVFERLVPDFMPERLQNPNQTAAYAWTGPRTVLGVASYCGDCGRMTFAEVFPDAKRNGTEQGKIILASLKDHALAERVLWSVYGVAFEVPGPYTLTRPTLMPGRLQFLFQCGRRQWLRVERWTLASPMLEGLSLAAWPTELLRASRLRMVGAPVTVSEQVNGLEACAFDVRVSQGLWRKDSVTGLVWRDPDAKKVLAVVAGQDTRDAVRRIADGVQCF